MTYAHDGVWRGCGAATMEILLIRLLAAAVWMGMLFVARIGDQLAAAVRGAALGL